MAINKGIFGQESNINDRYIPDFKKLGELVGYWKAMGLKIVLTSGTFDLVHEGHALYLEKAKSLGDLLIVGVDSDEKVRKRKGPDRPIVPQDERLRMLTHLRYVDVVTLKQVDEPKWSLIKTVKPDVLVATKKTYTDEQIKTLKKDLCGDVAVLEPMATTSTTARIRLVQIGGADKLAQKLAEELPKQIRQAYSELIEGA